MELTALPRGSLVGLNHASRIYPTCALENPNSGKPEFGGWNSLPASVDKSGRLHIGFEFARYGALWLHRNLWGDLKSLTNFGEDVFLHRVIGYAPLNLNQ